MLLAARELPGPTLQQRRQPQQLCRLPETLLALGLANLAHLQTELDVVCHVHVREERIVLEHHGNAALCRRHMGDVATIDAHRPRGGHVQPGNHAQGGGFAAARRAEQDAKRAWFNAQIHGMQGRGVTPGFGDVLQLDQRHRASLERLDDSRVSTQIQPNKTGASGACYLLISDRNDLESSFLNAKAASISIASVHEKSPDCLRRPGLAVWPRNRRGLTWASPP
ncbi:hypothetical protein SDC9_163648 [bioreactor metagenome]|uniref:Uncharacterized protein n=1 Tax=bioreactor metagenome TaxID=1076179 RepID=A0A645FS97_9ZZZZ